MAGRPAEDRGAAAETLRTSATVTGLAANYSQLINRQILALDQSLDMMAHEWEADPRRFDLDNARARSKVLTGISRDMFLADENGVIRQSTVSDFIGQSVGDLEVFRDAAEHANDPPKLLLGPAAVNPIMRQWHLDAARTLHHPDGSFAGIIDADYRVSAINEVFASAAPPGNGFAALINMTDGKLRTTFGSAGAHRTPTSPIPRCSARSMPPTRASGSARPPPTPCFVSTRFVAYRAATWRSSSGRTERHERGRRVAMAGAHIRRVHHRPDAGHYRADPRWSARGTAADPGRAGPSDALAAANALAEVSRALGAGPLLGADEGDLRGGHGRHRDSIAHLYLVEWNVVVSLNTPASTPASSAPACRMEDVLRMQARSRLFRSGYGCGGGSGAPGRRCCAPAISASSQTFNASATWWIELRCRPRREAVPSRCTPT